MTKHINGRKLSKSHKVISKSFSGATIEDLEHHVKPSLKYKPDNIIIHAGTNNLRKDNQNEIKNNLDKLVSGIKTELPSVDIAISSVIRRSDNPALNSKILEVNNILKTYCGQNNFDFINNDNIREQFLNTGGLHLIPRGIQTLASNVRNYITY
jgi:lysophospholipase L1-like esterase